MSALAETEHQLFRFLSRKLTKEDLKQIHGRFQLMDEVDEETREEIKDHVFQMIWNRVHWLGLLEDLRRETGADDASDPEEEEDED